MAIYDHPATLAYLTSRPLFQMRDMSDAQLKSVTNQLRKYRNSAAAQTMVVPDSEAVLFYAYNHAMALISQRYAAHEPLPDDLLEVASTYVDMASQQAVRAFYYLILICTREARHAHNTYAQLGAINNKFGGSLGTWLHNHDGDEEIIENGLMNSTPNTPIGPYVQMLQWVFYNLSFSSSFGGQPWGQVTDCLVSFVKGEFSAEMMLDTNWTLAHNNGPIFNKGHLYKHYTAQLQELLDVQRSGQIPHLVIAGSDPYSPPKKGDPALEDHLRMVHHMAILRKHFPDQISDEVDWNLVAATAVTGVAQKHGAKKPEKADIPPALKVNVKAKVDIANSFEVMPGVYLPKVKRAKKAA